MGVLSDIVIADDSQADAVAAMAAPSQELPGADVKGIDTIKLATLESLLTGKPYEEVFAHYDPIAQESDDGPWVFSLGRPLLTELAAAPDSKLSAVAERWANTEEFQLDGWPQDAVLQVVKELAGLSQRAIAENKGLLLWMSL